MVIHKLAEQAGYSYSYVAEIEQGKKDVNWTVLQAISRALGLSLVELVEEDGLPNDEMQMLNTYRNLNTRDRGAVLQHAKALFGREV